VDELAHLAGTVPATSPSGGLVRYLPPTLLAHLVGTYTCKPTAWRKFRPPAAALAIDSEPLTASAIFGDNKNPSETGWVA
jgi:hypothetical protein